MDLQTYRITAGLEKPLTLLHLSDTHICLADERDNERKNRLAGIGNTDLGAAHFLYAGDEGG